MKKFLKKKWYLLIIVLLIAGFIFTRFTAAKPSTKKEQPHTVKKEDLKEVLSLSGKIDADESITLRFQTSGKLVWVGVKEGDAVKKYQSIASLDQREIKSRLNKYLNSYMKTRWDFEQTKDNYKDTIVIDSVKRILEKSQFDLNNSVLDVEIQNLALEFANLWTPIDGVVTRVESPKAGVNITPAQAEFDIVNPNTIYFLATADQNDVIKLKDNMPGNITLDAFSEATTSGNIKFISFVPKSDEAGTVYKVKVVLNDNKLPLRIGMTGDAEFTLKEKADALAIPSSYIKTEGGKYYVLKKQGDDRKKTYIILGDEWGEMTEIKEGLLENDVIY